MNINQNTYGIGIVGCGNISDTHAQAIMESKKGQLIAAHSRTQSTVEAFCGRYDITAYPTYEAFLANPNLDIVVICTPSGTHLDYGELAAEAGKHVVVEKPIEVSVERGRSLIGSCRKNGVELAVIYQSRFIDDVIRMKQAIDRGDIGRPIMARGAVKWYRSREYYSGSTWRGTFELDGGGAVINQSIHTIDLLQWFMSGVESVVGYKDTLTHEMIEAEDNAVVCLRFNNGAIGVFEASTSILPAQKRKIEVSGTKGTARLEGDTFYMQLGEQENEDKQKESSEAAGAESPLAGMSFQNHKRQYDQILDAFLNHKEPIVGGMESLKSLAIVQALYKSADRQESVFVEEILAGKN